MSGMLEIFVKGTRKRWSFVGESSSYNDTYDLGTFEATTCLNRYGIESLLSSRYDATNLPEGYTVRITHSIVNPNDPLRIPVPCPEYYFKVVASGEWRQYNHLLPYTINDKKNTDLDTAVVRVYTRERKVYPPLTPVRIRDGSHVTSWVIENCSIERVAPNLWLQTFYLIEPIEMFKGYYLGNVTVTQPINPDSYHPRSTLYDVLVRVLKISPSPAYKPLQASNSYIDPSRFDEIVFKSGNWLTMFQETESPEFVFTEATRYEALVEIGLYLDMQPKLEFSDDGRLFLYFEELDLSEKNNYTIDKPLIEEEQQPLSNYASEVVSKISNLNISDAIVYPGEGLGVYVEAPEGEYDINLTRAIITLPHKIQKVIKFEVSPMAEIDQNIYRDMTDYCLEYGEWTKLPPNKDDRAKVYYRYNDNKLYNIYDFWERHIRLPYLGAALFRITYIPILDTKLSIDNDAPNPYMVIYNQTGNIVDNRSYAEHLRNYIKRMKHGDYVVTHRYKNIDEIPKVGHLVNDEYVITNINYVKYPTYYDVTLHLAKEYTRRAEFIRAKEEIRNWEIPADKTIERMLTIKEKAYLAFGEYEGANKIAQTSVVKGLNHIERLLPALYNDNYRAAKEGAVFGIRFKTIDGEVIPITMPAIKTTFGTSRLYTFKAPHNVIMGYSKAFGSWSPGVTKQVGVVYTDRYGNFESLDLGIKYDHTIDDVKEFALNFPLSTIDEVDDILSKSTIRLYDLQVNKDAREILGFTYQIEFAPEQDEYISPKAVANIESVKTQYITFLNTTITSPYPLSEDQIIRANPVINTNETFEYITYNMNPLAPIPANYRAVALTVVENGKHYPLIVRNNPDERTRFLLIDRHGITLYLKY